MDLSLGINDLSHGCSSALGAGLRAFHTVDNVTGDLNIIILEKKMSENVALADPRSKKAYSKFADFGIINTHYLIFLWRAQAKTRNEVHSEKNDTGSEEGICHSSDRVSKLVSQLDIVLVNPAAIDFGDAIQVRNVITICPS